MYNKLKDFQNTIVAVIVAFALIISTCACVNMLKKDEIAVTGSAFKIVKSDTASLTIYIKSYNASKSAAYATVQKQLPVVKNYFKQNGIKENEINVLTADTYETYKSNPNTGYTTNIVEGYNFSQEIVIKSNDVDKIKDLSISAQELLDKGINISVNSPQYSYSKLGEIKIELLKAASEDAKQRAKGMLSATNNSVGKISSVKMGVFQITPPESNDVSDSGMNDTSSIEKKITAVANVVFKIK